ncbi:MAG TPA: peptidyl-prolyl cis-trans isomerase [Terriglobales bacterium]|nr:peptidyl-prolyl cis-trans isomerase [Terriglobales bacterium]
MIQRHSLFFCTYFLAGAWFVVGQTTPNSAPGSAPGHGAPAPMTSAAPAIPSIQSVPEGTPVITIDGVCDISLNGTTKAAAPVRTGTSRSANAKRPTEQSPTSCKTQITRAEFEKLLKAVAPNAPATVNRQIATRYVQLLTAANEGVKLGINKDPEYEEQLAIARLQVLAQTAERKLQTEAANVSEADEKAYYDQNPSAFEEVTLTRIFIPRNPATPTNTGSAPAQPAATDPQAIADEAHKQLAAGDDPEKVEKTAYEQLKNTTAPPSTKFGSRRRGSLPPAQEAKIFALNSGDVSEVFSDSVGYTIYKLDSKKELPLDQVKDDIKRRLTQQHLEDSRQKIMGASKAEYNDAYFGPESTPARPAPPRIPGAPNAGATPASPSTATPSTTPK